MATTAAAVHSVKQMIHVLIVLHGVLDVGRCGWLVNSLLLLLLLLLRWDILIVLSLT